MGIPDRLTCLLRNLYAGQEATVRTGHGIWNNRLVPNRKRRTSLVAQTVKHLAYNVGDLGSIPGSGRSSGEGNGNSSTPAWKIPWTKEHGGLQSTRSQRVRPD